MRKFKCSPFGYEVDLGDPKTYKHLPQNTKELRKLMFQEIGYSHYYMNYLHKNIFDSAIGCEQKERVEQLVKNFAENEKQNIENHYNKFFRIKDDEWSLDEWAMSLANFLKIEND